MKIDAHQHFWDLRKGDYPWIVPELGPLYRSFAPDELEPLIWKAGIDKTIIVQAMDSFADTDYMLEVAAAKIWVGGVVGWVPLDNPEEAGRRLEMYVRNPLFKGVRNLNHAAWLNRAPAIEGLKLLASHGLTLDVLAGSPNDLECVSALAEKVPGLKIVIDHLARPPFGQLSMEPWAGLMAGIAQYPQVFIKISGVHAAEAWKNGMKPDFQPYLDFVFEKFGSDRLMFGSDWPVSTQAADYETVWKDTNEALADYTETEIQAILGGTASECYRIDETLN